MLALARARQASIATAMNASWMSGQKSEGFMTENTAAWF